MAVPYPPLDRAASIMARIPALSGSGSVGQAAIKLASSALSSGMLSVGVGLDHVGLGMRLSDLHTPALPWAWVAKGWLCEGLRICIDARRRLGSCHWWGWRRPKREMQMQRGDLTALWKVPACLPATGAS